MATALAGMAVLLAASAARAASPSCNRVAAETDGCTREHPVEADKMRTAEAGPDTLRILGADGDIRFDGSGDPNHIVLRPGMRGLNPNGAYRTMCVRTCDGYYFPISYAVTPAQFTADEQACEQRCPGAEVQLFYHRVPDEDAEQMISASDGKPYTALPHAFLYRALNRSPAGQCSCQEGGGRSFQGAGAQPGFRILEPETTPAPSVDGSIVTIPAAQPAPAAPTAAAPVVQPSLSGADSKADTAAQSLPPARTLPAKSDEPVRVVGPKFFPDPSEAEVLRAPGPQPDR